MSCKHFSGKLFFHINIYSGLIISGGSTSGNSAEIYVPSTGQHCQLPDLPGSRRYHQTMEKLSVCGGTKSLTRKSCLTLRNGTWETTTTLLEDRLSYFTCLVSFMLKIILIFRRYHCSWDSPSGIILLGGWDSPTTTEKIQADGTSSYSFNLRYNAV